jgi:preprotein translocase subunit YajC
VFLIVLPARRKERQQRELLFNTLKKNDEVLTSGGIIGTVANIKDDEVTLKVDESSNVRIRILRNSIIRILTPKDQGSPAGTDAVKAGSPPAN